MRLWSRTSTPSCANTRAEDLTHGILQQVRNQASQRNVAATGRRAGGRGATAAILANIPALEATNKAIAANKAAGDLISARQMEYAALMAYEVGKTRLEALGEVEEAADLLRYYAQTFEDNKGFDHPMGNLGDSAVHTRSILRPHGVFAVIAPFNFPMALASGPIAAALMAGEIDLALGIFPVLPKRIERSTRSRGRLPKLNTPRK